MNPPPKNDPARLMRLLWRGSVAAPPQPGRRPSLTIDAIVAAAMAIADQDGLDAVTVRRLAGVLNVAAMSIYTYVSGKAELAPLMLDAAYLAAPRSVPASPGWRDRLTAVALDNRALMARRPWTAQASPGRPVLGPGAMAKYEHELGAFEGMGLSELETDSALTFLLGFVASCARAEQALKAQEAESQQTDQAWWDENGPLLALAFDPERYPLAARIGAAAGEALQGAYDPDHAWAFGLDRVLDGIGTLIRPR